MPERGSVDQGEAPSICQLSGSTMSRQDMPPRQPGVEAAGGVAAVGSGGVQESTSKASRGWVIAGNVLGLAPILVQDPVSALEDHQSARHPAAINHPPPFIAAPGETDVLLVVMTLFLVAAVLAVGVFFFWLHSLPERLAHNSTKVHFDIVAALGLLSLFTHIHLFWVAALLLALVRIPIPDFTGLLGRIAGSLEKMAEATPGKTGAASFENIGAGAPTKSDPPPARKVTHA